MPKVTQLDSCIEVSYPVREATIEITHAEHALILMFSHEKVKMIKFIRAQYNLGLYDAKQVVDTVIASADVKPETERVSSGIHWSSLSPGTLIHVRDSEYESWVEREFLAYDQCKIYRFLCTDSTEGTVPWKYAKLANVYF